ncbi:MAG: methionine adenosyltransferase domain-containing protein [Patescibacteria group bacterium]|nr:methionine adenosyltransferase domain-containing protein [Patescibacteria group bacterium]MDD4304522.1 methionine adenosyltransferase domain-containing protein [Patescibacteria group bacterium]MDD4694882.1 methionine adenosyltransferase domain-containing protein [Patescibacteria group bacterium]
MIKTAEFVSPKHPDKICDFIADSILDAYLENDKDSRVAIEVMGGHKLITINGEVTSKSKPNIESIVKNIVGNDYKIISNIVLQSLSISQGVDIGGAGDQGIMKGYATNETEIYLPLEYVLARNLCQKVFEIYPYDGKTQVTIKDNEVLTVVVSFQNTKNDKLLELVKEIIKADEYLINPSGEWTQGGFDADTGLSGRKLVVDNYGPEIAIGGGSFSGKDYTKVDRSGAYMARKIAVDLLKKNNAKEVYTKLAYAIGKSNPVMAVAIIDGVEQEITGYDLSPMGIRKCLKLDEIKFVDTCTWGHFGGDFEWDK